MKILPFPFKTTPGTRNCALEAPVSGPYYGYGVVLDTSALAFKSEISVYIPFPYAKGPIDSAGIVTARVRKRSIFPLDNAVPFSQYTYYVHEGEAPLTEPLKHDCIVIVNPEGMLNTINSLREEYEFFYVLRTCRNSRIVDYVKDSKSQPRMCLFRVEDVYPPDVYNTDGVVVKVHDGKYDYVDVVFSNTPHMFDTDGFTFRSPYSFEGTVAATRRVTSLYEQLVAPKPKKKPPPKKTKKDSIKYKYTDETEYMKMKLDYATFTTTDTAGNVVRVAVPQRDR